jgi:hypothetical protein
MKKSTYILLFILISGCSQLNHYQYFADSNETEVRYKPFLDTKEVAALNLDEREIVLSVIADHIANSELVFELYQESDKEFIFYIGVFGKNPPDILDEIVTPAILSLMHISDGSLRNGQVYHEDHNIIPEIFSISKIEFTNGKAIVEVYSYRSPLNAAKYKVELQKEGEKWIVQCWEEIWIA